MPPMEIKKSQHSLYYLQWTYVHNEKINMKGNNYYDDDNQYIVLVIYTKKSQ